MKCPTCGTENLKVTLPDAPEVDIKADLIKLIGKTNKNTPNFCIFTCINCGKQESGRYVEILELLNRKK